MPIPKPRDGETENDFMSRCMSNDVMQSEYPDQDQRVAICETSWRDSKTMSDRFSWISGKQFKERVKSGDSGSCGVRKQFVPDEVKQEGGADSRKFRFTISTAAVDRDLGVKILHVGLQDVHPPVWFSSFPAS